MKRCPACAEDVRVEADVCRYCGHAFPGGRAWQAQERRVWAIVAVVIVAICLGAAWFAVSSFDRARDQACIVDC